MINLLLAALVAVFPAPVANQVQTTPNPRGIVSPERPDSGMPPLRFRVPGQALITFADQAAIDTFCGKAPPPHRIVACHYRVAGVSVIMMPLPCGYADTEYYARVICHEMGHSAGWTGFHEE